MNVRYTYRATLWTINDANFLWKYAFLEPCFLVSTLETREQAYFPKRLARGCQRCNLVFTTERPQFCEFEKASYRACRLKLKKAMLEVATSNLQK